MTAAGESLLSKASKHFLFSWRLRETKPEDEICIPKSVGKLIYIYFVPPASVFGVGPPACDLLVASASLLRGCVCSRCCDRRTELVPSRVYRCSRSLEFLLCWFVLNAPQPTTNTLGIHPDYTEECFFFSFFARAGLTAPFLSPLILSLSPHSSPDPFPPLQAASG